MWSPAEVKCVFPVLYGAYNFLKAHPRGGEALHAIRARKSSANQRKKNGFEHPGSDPFLSPPFETDSAPEAHPNTYFS